MFYIIRSSTIFHFKSQKRLTQTSRNSRTFFNSPWQFELSGGNCINKALFCDSGFRIRENILKHMSRRVTWVYISKKKTWHKFGINIQT